MTKGLNYLYTNFKGFIMKYQVFLKSGNSVIVKAKFNITDNNRYIFHNNDNYESKHLSKSSIIGFDDSFSWFLVSEVEGIVYLSDDQG